MSALTVDPEKKSLTASERLETARLAWQQTAAPVRAVDLVFVDETGSLLGLMP
jgi:hypothetical protein